MLMAEQGDNPSEDAALARDEGADGLAARTRSLLAELERCQSAAHIGAFAYDLAQGTWSSSPELDSMVGIDANYPRTLESGLALVAPVWRERVKSMLASCPGVTKRETIFEIVRHKDGVLRWVRVTTERLTQQDGSCQMVGTMLDIDDETRCDAVRQAILDATNEGVLVISGTSVVRQFNRRFVELWRVPDVVAQSRDARLMLEYVSSQTPDPVAFLTLVRRIQESDARTNDRIQLSCGRIFEAFSARLPLHGQTPERLFLFRDITTQAQAQVELAEREALLGECQRAAQIGSWELDVSSGRMHWTAECYRIFGVNPETCEPTLSWLHEVVLPGDEPLLSDHYARVMATLAFPPLEYRIKTPDGRVRWVHVTGAVECDSAGKPRRLYGTQQDVTERKAAEQTRLDLERRFLHSQKLESLGVLAGGIAHDFNNLLMAILGNLDLALPSLPEGHSAIEDVEQAMIAARKAADLTRQMLAYSGRSKFVVEPVDLGQVIEQDVSLLRACTSKRTELTLHLEPDVPPVLVDRGQFQQVVMNLITNASEAIGESEGVITLSLGTRDFAAQELARTRLHETAAPGRYAFLLVEDSGCGMTQETQDRLFDPFYSTKLAGRGLGMSAILGIVRAHRGAIFLCSDEGRGTSIEVLFPACDTTTNKRPSSIPQPAFTIAVPSSRGTKQILLVDDEDSVRRVCEQMLKRLGWSVLTANGGPQALELFGTHAQDIACVILDWSMPQMNGLEVWKALHQMDPEAIAILSSGYAWNSSSAHDLCCQGIAGFIQKPYELAGLERELRRVLGSRPAC